MRCYAGEKHPGGQDKEAGDGGQGLDEDVQGEGDLEVACIKERMGRTRY